MAAIEKRTTQILIAFAAVLFIVYLIAGAIDILAGFGILPITVFVPSPVRGLVLVIISIVFLTSLRELTKDAIEGIHFLLVGGMLAFLVFLLDVIVLASHALGWLLALEDWVEWTVASDLGPSILLFPITIPLIYVHRKGKQRRTRHTRTDAEEKETDNNGNL